MPSRCPADRHTSLQRVKKWGSESKGTGLAVFKRPVLLEAHTWAQQAWVQLSQIHPNEVAPSKGCQFVDLLLPLYFQRSWYKPQEMAIYLGKVILGPSRERNPSNKHSPPHLTKGSLWGDFFWVSESASGLPEKQWCAGWGGSGSSGIGHWPPCNPRGGLVFIRFSYVPDTV